MRLNAPVGQTLIQRSVCVANTASKSDVRGSEIMETTPLLIQHRPGSSFLSSHILIQSPHFIHFAFSKIRPVL